MTHLSDTASNLAWDYQYDPLDRLTGADLALASGGGSYGYRYDRLGNLTGRSDSLAGFSLSLTYPGNAPRPHTPTEVRDGANSLLASFGYDANGNRQAITNAAGDHYTNTTYTFNSENRLAEVISGSQTTTFVYDGDGRRVKRLAYGGETTIDVGDHYQIIPDQMSQEAIDLVWIFDQDQEGWIFDARMSGVDSSIEWTGTDGSPSPGSIQVHSTQMETTGSAPNLVNYIEPGYYISPDSELSFRVRQQTQSNRFIETRSEISTQNHASYQPISQYWLTRFDSSWITITGSLSDYAGEEVTRVRIIHEFLQPQFACDIYNDSVTITNLRQRRDSITKHYFANGQRLATRVNDELYYVHTDHLGSTTLLTNADGSETGHILYDAFGNTISSTLPITLTDRLYTGQRSEPDLGLYDYNARFYDPYLNRFISPDTMVPDPVNPQQFNRYAYCLNNPLRYIDPSGHQGCPPGMSYCPEDPMKALRDMWYQVFGPDSKNKYPDGPQRTIFIQSSVAVEGDIAPGIEASYAEAWALNFYTGKLTKLHTVSLSITGSTPEGLSGNVALKGGTAKVSTTDAILGPSQAYGGSIAADLLVQGGLTGEYSEGLTDFWLDSDFWRALAKSNLAEASNLATRLARDPSTGESVRVYSVGPFVGINAVPNDLEIGISWSPGTNYTWKSTEINVYPWKYFESR